VYTQDFDPVSDSLGLTAIFAVLPILTLFVLLGGLKMKAQWAALIALGIAMAVAMIVYGMPVGQTGLSALEGATFGLFPIMWIVVAAIWVYNMTVETGYFAVLRRSFGRISEDQRIQAVIIAFCFGALIEALAGFGTPVAITAVMMIAVGFKPIKAASIALVANTAPVAFGAIATPIITLAEVTELDKADLGAMVGRQTPFLALLVPLILIGMVDGRRGIRQAWPVAVVGGLSFAIGQFICSNYLSVELTDIVASLVSTASIVSFLRIWSPGEPLRAEALNGGLPGPAVAGGSVHDPGLEREVARHDDTKRDTPADIFRAYSPYMIIIAVFSIAQIPAVKDALAESPWTKTFEWPGLDVRSPDGEPLSSLTFNFNWLPATGTLMIFSGLITMAVIRLAPGRALRVFGRTLDQL
jgi:lactate permease